MANFKVAVSWSMQADFEIEADNLDEAKRLAQLKAIPIEGEYIDGSWEVNDDVTDFYLEEEK